MALLVSNVSGDFKMGIKQEDDLKVWLMEQAMTKSLEF